MRVLAAARERREIPAPGKPTRSRTNERKRRRLASVGMAAGSRCLGHRAWLGQALGTGDETRRKLQRSLWTNERKRRRLASVGMTVGTDVWDTTLELDEALGVGGETRRGLREAVDVRSQAGLNFLMKPVGLVAGGVGAHVAPGGDRGVVHATFVMDVRARGAAADAGVANHFAALDAR